METLLTYICENATYAPYMIFGLLLLTGFNIPISEELILLCAGAIGSSCGHGIDTIFYMYAWTYLGCWIAAWEAYAIGRYFGPKLFEYRWCKRILSKHRLEKLKHYLQRFGIWTFILGRFIPGGVRNAIFMSSGLTQMPFKTFVLRDAVGCLIASLFFFYMGHLFGENYQALMHTFKEYEKIILILLAVIILSGIGTLLYMYIRKESLGKK